MTDMKTKLQRSSIIAELNTAIRQLCAYCCSWFIKRSWQCWHSRWFSRDPQVICTRWSIWKQSRHREIDYKICQNAWGIYDEFGGHKINIFCKWKNRSSTFQQIEWEAQRMYTHSQGSKLQDLQSDKDYKSSVQTSYWKRQTSRSQIRRLDHGRSQSHHLATMIDMQLLCKIWPLNGFEVNHAKRKLQQKRWGTYLSLLYPEARSKVINIFICKKTIQWHLEGLVGFCDEISVRPRFIDPRRKAL